MQVGKRSFLCVSAYLHKETTIFGSDMLIKKLRWCAKEIPSHTLSYAYMRSCILSKEITALGLSVQTPTIGEVFKFPF
jgi:hypothetical protein